MKTPPNKTRLDGKLPGYESPLIDQVENLKKFVYECSSVYQPTNTPTSANKPKNRQTKDKSPFAANRFSALDEVAVAFKEDDQYLISKYDQIVVMLKNEVEAITRSFDAFVDESSNWIQAHYDKRKMICDTTIAHMNGRIEEEAQLNYFILLTEDHCIIDKRKLFNANEAVPVIPVQFDSNLLEECTKSSPEDLFENIFEFVSKSNHFE